METKYYVYEITGGVAYWLMFSFLVMVVAAITAFTGHVDPKTAFGAYLLTDIIGTALLSGHKVKADASDLRGVV